MSWCDRQLQMLVVKDSRWLVVGGGRCWQKWGQQQPLLVPELLCFNSLSSHGPTACIMSGKGKLTVFWNWKGVLTTDQCFVSSWSGGFLWKGPLGQKQAEQTARGRIRFTGRGAKSSGEEAPHHRLPGPFISFSAQRLHIITSQQTSSSTYVIKSKVPLNLLPQSSGLL